jgi:hypothetical protein
MQTRLNYHSNTIKSSKTKLYPKIVQPQKATSFAQTAKVNGMKKLKKTLSRWLKHLLLLTITFLTGATLGYNTHHDLHINWEASQ